MGGVGGRWSELVPAGIKTSLEVSYDCYTVEKVVPGKMRDRSTMSTSKARISGLGLCLFSPRSSAISLQHTRCMRFDSEVKGR